MGNRNTILIVGASGATGQQVVEQLLKREQKLRVIVRSPDKVPQHWHTNTNIEIIGATLLELSDAQMLNYVGDCHAIISCLGHNLSRKGMYGQPRKLVTKAVQRLTNAVIATKPEQALRYILMNTTGNRNRDLKEPISLAQKCVILLLRCLLPPHLDNELAAEYLRSQFGQNHALVEWVAVRPDTLIDEDKVSDYSLYASPTRSALFNAGKTSRINVAHFMCELACTTNLWEQWKGQMPVIYNVEKE